MYRFSCFLSFCRKSRPLVVISNHRSPIVTLVHRNFQLDKRLFSDLKGKSPLSNLLSKSQENVIAQPEPSKEQEDEETRKQREKSWRTMKITLWIFGLTFAGLGTYMIITLGAPEKDEDGNFLDDEFSSKPLWKAYLMRTFKELEYYQRLIKEPSREKLLPDPLEYPYIQPKYTLVIELTDVLVHPEWSYNTGWRFKKRPMLDYFLETLKDHYEIVIYTAEQGITVFPLVEAIDPKNIIAYKLVRDATHFTGGHHVKSLSNLNRDLTKVICVDWNPKNVMFNPENLFCIRRWTGNDGDTSLYYLANFLKVVSENDIEDVRQVLKVYSSYEDPIEGFKEKQKLLAEELKAQAAIKKDMEKSKYSSWSPSIFKRSSF